jgi:ABC-type transport system involved in multi-copper enzyme maturation permease subunit
VLFLGTIYGDLESARITRVLILLTLTVMSLSALTMLVSSITRNQRETWAAMIGIILLAQLAPLTAGGLIESMVRFGLLSSNHLLDGERWTRELRQHADPLLLIREELNTDPRAVPPDGRRVAVFGLAHLTATMFFLRLTCVFLGRGGGVTGDAGPAARLRLPRRQVRFGDRPVLAREWRLGSSSVGERMLDWLLLVGTALAFWLPALSAVYPTQVDWSVWLGNFTEFDLLGHLPWTGGSLAGLALIRTAFRAGGSVSNEHERDTLESLLSTPLATRAIIEGKIIGSCRPMASFLMIAVPPLVIMLMSGRIGPYGVLGPLLMLPPLALVAAVVGVAFDARFGRRSIATLASIGVVLTLALVSAWWDESHFGSRLLEKTRQSPSWVVPEPRSFTVLWPSTVDYQQRFLHFQKDQVARFDREAPWLPALAFRPRTSPIIDVDVRVLMTPPLLLLAALAWWLRHAGTRAFLRRTGRVEGIVTRDSTSSRSP